MYVSHRYQFLKSLHQLWCRRHMYNEYCSVFTNAYFVWHILHIHQLDFNYLKTVNSRRHHEPFSTSCRWVCNWSVRGVSLYVIFALADTWDSSIIIQHHLNSILIKALKITVHYGSAALLNLIILKAPTTEERVMINIKAIREAKFYSLLIMIY